MLPIVQSKIFCLPTSYKNLKIKIYRTVILPVVLYGCETRSLTLREEHRLRVFENRVLRKIFGPKREGDGSWRKLHNDELHINIFNSSHAEFSSNKCIHFQICMVTSTVICCCHIGWLRHICRSLFLFILLNNIHIPSKKKCVWTRNLVLNTETVNNMLGKLQSPTPFSKNTTQIPTKSYEETYGVIHKIY
jgi:hypothetical protein